MDDPVGKSKRLQKEVAPKAERKLKARRENHSVWFGFGLFGIIGWSVAVPTVLGILLGIWLDNHWPGRISWTLTLMFVGVAFGCANAWHWINRETRG